MPTFFIPSLNRVLRMTSMKFHLPSFTDSICKLFLGWSELKKILFLFLCPTYFPNFFPPLYSWANFMINAWLFVGTTKPIYKLTLLVQTWSGTCVTIRRNMPWYMHHFSPKWSQRVVYPFFRLFAEWQEMKRRSRKENGNSIHVFDDEFEWKIRRR